MIELFITIRESLFLSSQFYVGEKKKKKKDKKKKKMKENFNEEQNEVEQSEYNENQEEGNDRNRGNIQHRSNNLKNKKRRNQEDQVVFSHNNQTDLYRQENTNNSKKKNEMKEMKKKKINFDESDRNIAPINYLDSHGVPFGAQMNMNEVQNDLYRNERIENNENVEKNNENVEKNKKGKKLKKRRNRTYKFSQPTKTIADGWCHQCKFKRDQLLACINFWKGNKENKCSGKYCAKCIDKIYDEKMEELKELNHWICYSCLRRCTCLNCKRKRKKEDQKLREFQFGFQNNFNFPPYFNYSQTNAQQFQHFQQIQQNGLNFNENPIFQNNFNNISSHFDQNSLDPLGRSPHLDEAQRTRQKMITCTPIIKNHSRKKKTFLFFNEEQKRFEKIAQNQVNNNNNNNDFDQIFLESNQQTNSTKNNCYQHLNEKDLFNSSDPVPSASSGEESIVVLENHRHFDSINSFPLDCVAFHIYYDCSLDKMPQIYL